MDVEILEKSRNFLSRYQLLHLMEVIVAEDTDATPLAARTIDYFISAFLDKYAFTDEHRFHRFIYNPDDSDVDENGNTTKPRRPPHIPRAEVRGIFAAQAKWILADQLAKRESKRVVNVEKWKIFCLQVRRARRDARNKGVRWGIEYGKESDADDSDWAAPQEDNGSDVDLSRVRIVGKDIEILNKAKKKKRKVIQVWLIKC